MKIGFIGVGNMGGAILKGYAPIVETESNEIFIFDAKETICTQLEERFASVTASPTMDKLVRRSDVIFLGIKPQIFKEVLPSISACYTNNKTLVSMAAGIPIQFIEDYLGQRARIVRIMPNLPAQVKESMIAVCHNDNVEEDILEKLFEIFRSIGKAELIEEGLMHCVIGVSGSSPAYTYMYIDALMQGAMKNGMDPQSAKIFAAQSVLGAAKMVLKTSLSPEQLWTNVCSPGGTTVEAVNYLKNNNFTETVKDAFQAAVEKSKGLEKHVF